MFHFHYDQQNIKKTPPELSQCLLNKFQDSKNFVINIKLINNKIFNNLFIHILIKEKIF